MSTISVATSAAAGTLENAKTQMAIDKMAKASKAASSLSPKDMERIDKTAQDFEAVFITEMLKPMMNMVKVDDTFGGGKGEEVFRDFTTNEYGKQLAANGGFGIAQHVKEQLIRMQANAAHGAE